MSQPLPSALDWLRREPQRFEFDATVRLLMLEARSADPASVMDFRAVPSLAQPSVDVTAVGSKGEDGRPLVANTVMGLIGPSGVLPRGYTEIVQSTLRDRSRALPDFLDLLSTRLVAHFAAARTKYRPHRIAELASFGPGIPFDKLSQLLLALTGYANAGMLERLEMGALPLCHYAGFFAMRPRSADRMEALASDWLGSRVEVIQFAGTWLSIPPNQRTVLAQGSLAGRFDRLGVDAAVGTRAWDAQARVILRIGPLALTAFSALLPDGPALRRLVSLVRAYLGFETGFAINPVLSAAEIPPLRLVPTGESNGDETEARLGWNTWLPIDARRTDGTEPVFEDEIIEGLCTGTVA